MRKQNRFTEQFLQNFSIGQLELLHRYYHWARDRVLRGHRLRHVHLTMIRLIRLQSSLTMRQLRTVTGYSRSAMNKHRDFLVECKLIRELPKNGDRRMIHLGCTEKGKRRLEEIDNAIEVEFMKAVGFGRRLQLKAFSVKLEEALSDFPSEQKSYRRAYPLAADKKAPEDQPSLPLLRFVEPSQKADIQNSASVQPKQSSGNSQVEDDPGIPW